MTKQEPQMMICPNHKVCITPTCPHIKAHKHFGRDCELGWCLDKGNGGACIPVEPEMGKMLEQAMAEEGR